MPAAMAFETGFSSPFSPLHHLGEMIPSGRCLKLPHSSHRLGGTASGKITRENLIWGLALCEAAAKPTAGCTASGTREQDRMSVDEPFYWTKLASRFVPFNAHAEGPAGLSGGVLFDSPGEQQRSPLLDSLSLGIIEGNGLHANLHWGSASAAVQSISSHKQKHEEPEKQNFYVNIGHAIRTLREELPCMFYKELSYDIYRQDIVFRDPMHMVGGIDNYKLIFKALRFHGRLFFKALWVDILWVWQPSDKVIMVRWQVRGIPRVPWESHGIFDGISEYKLDKEGKIYEHKVDNVALNSRPKLKVPTMAELLRMATCPSTPKPTYFHKAQDVVMALLPYLAQFTWVRYYLALKGTVHLYHNR